MKSQPSKYTGPTEDVRRVRLVRGRRASWNVAPCVSHWLLMIVVDPSGPLITTYGWILRSCAQFQHFSLNVPLVFLDLGWHHHAVPCAAQDFGFVALSADPLSPRAGYTTGLVECLTRPVVEREESQREKRIVSW